MLKDQRDTIRAGRIRLTAGALLLAACVGLPKAVFACPLCYSQTARQVRAGLFDSHLAQNLAVTALPFPVLVAIVTLTYYGLPSPAWRCPRSVREKKGQKSP